MRTMKLAKLGIIVAACLSLSQFVNYGFAEEVLAAGQHPAATPPAIQSVKTDIDQKKLALAKELTDWLQTTLQGKKALIAVVARKGGSDVKRHDRTGMAHTGLAVYDPRAQTWLIYNLVQDKKSADSPPEGTTESVWRTAPLDFFYSQTGYDKEALILIPETETQQRLYAALVDGRYKQLSAIHTYNLLSPYDSLKSFNCNKWLLFNLMAARMDNYDLAMVAQAVHAAFSPGLIWLSPLENFVAHRKSNVLASEWPSHLPLQVVTVESLYRSNLFTDKIFFSGKSTLE